jgi:peroxiredoxin Q/BCP
VWRGLCRIALRVLFLIGVRLWLWQAFKARYRLPFTLLSDDGNKLRKDWGVPSDLFGALAGRQTYVIDKDGRVQLIFNNQFEPEKHIAETLKVLQG